MNRLSAMQTRLFFSRHDGTQFASPDYSFWGVVVE